MRSVGRGLCLLLVLGLTGGIARAQYPGMAAGAAGNPFTTPTANPFLNPYAAAVMSQQPMDQSTAAMYFIAARQSGNGIGSGRMSGSRPALGATAPPAPGLEERRGGANVPGAGASRYFNRTTPVAGASTDHYYKRQPRQFPFNVSRR